jgi:hypothetical protein
MGAYLDTATRPEAHPEGWTPNRRGPVFGVHPLGCCGGSQAWWQCQDAPELLDVIVNDFVGTRLQ